MIMTMTVFYSHWSIPTCMSLDLDSIKLVKLGTDELEEQTSEATRKTQKHYNLASPKSDE